MALRAALVGDTMLGRGVAEVLSDAAPTSLVASEVAELMQAADVTVLNLECCISDRGAPVSLPGKRFFFRAPPRAVEVLAHLGVDCVTLANNHALDFGEVALLDTFSHLEATGIAWVGAGEDPKRARAPVTLSVGGEEVTVVGFTDHPADYAAGPGRPGVAYVDLRAGAEPWVVEAAAYGAGCVLVTPHWGPNMATEPRSYVRAAAAELVAAGASIVAGHSAHVFHGVDGKVLYDLGDFLDDYRVDPAVRNDLGLLFLVDIDHGQPRRLEAVPLKLGYCRTELATGEDARWIRRRFRDACAAFGQDVADVGGRLVVAW
jgi:poly-gamma-glutamate synthesis protein (capsule biosynthesis protein)